MLGYGLRPNPTYKSWVSEGLVCLNCSATLEPRHALFQNRRAGRCSPPLHPAALDLLYVQDLGLVTLQPQIAIANALYQEVIPCELTWSTQVTLTEDPAWYLRPDGSLDLLKLLAAFQQFFREHADSWLERFDYKEAGPQLLLQAFLQRIVNGGGRIDREYGLGLRRTDLLVQWPLDQAQGFLGPVQRVVIELKLLHKSLDATLREGLAQTADYLDRTGAREGHLLIFDRTPGAPWERKIFQREESHGSHRIRVWGM